MRTLQRMTTVLPRAPALRTIAIRTTTIDTLHARHSPSPRQADQPTATSPSSGGVGFASPQPNIFASNHRDTADHALSPRHHSPLDDRARSFYSTQIYHGQACPSSRRGIHSEHIGHGPATGAGTGVLISAQMFGAEVKGNPTESEADVAADRCDVDPLAPGLHHTIRLGAGDAAPRPTESEEDVVADREGADADPLWAARKGR